LLQPATELANFIPPFIFQVVPESPRQVASPGEIGESSPGPDPLHPAATSPGMRCIRTARGSLAITTTAQRIAR